ncbi:MAG: ABC transporter permease [Lachnospiraceae bacterium]|nr:ABC transporter permease [Lachnospiraceae bacterium]
MQVFKAFFRITKREITTCLINLGVFVALAVMIMNSNTSAVEDSFQEADIPIAIVDRDHSAESEAVEEYLNSTYHTVSVNDSKDDLQDALFFRDITYLVILPEGFSESLYKEDVSLADTVKVPDSYTSIYTDIDLEQFFSTLKLYVNSGYTVSEALDSIDQASKVSETSVTLRLREHATENHSKTYYYFRLLPYPLLALVISCISLLLLNFNKTDIKRRSLCSSLTLYSRNAQLTIASLILSLIFFTVTMGIGYILTKGTLFESSIWIYYMINGLIMTFTSLSIAYLIGISISSAEQVSMIGNIVSLSLCFLGGIFVPLSMISTKVQYFARILPTYWYTKINQTLGGYTVLPSALRKDIFGQYLLQLLTGFCIFCIALLISKQKTQRA